MLQVGLVDGISDFMAKKTAEAMRRVRILVEIPPEGGREIWNAAKGAAIRQEERLGEFIFQAIHEKILREMPEMLPAHMRDKPRKK